jgi:hypothetical protein
MCRADRTRLSAVLALVAGLATACGPAAPTGDPAGSTATTASPSSAGRPAREAGSAQASAAAASWETLDDAPFARLEMATAAHEGRIWLAGGLSPLGEALTDVDVLDPATGAWSDGPSLPAGVHHAALVSDGERLILIGGYLGSTFGQPTDVVLVLADGDDAWQAGPSLPDARAAGAAAWDGARVVYGGGIGVGVAADVYALEDETWSRIAGLGRPREHLAATSDGEGRTWFLGGRVGGLDTNLGAVEVLDGEAVTSHEPLPTPRGGVAAFYLPETGACVTGGEAPDRAFATVECIDRAGAISTLADLTVPHHGHGAAVVDGTAYVVLGGPEPTLSAGSVVERLILGAG